MFLNSFICLLDVIFLSLNGSHCFLAIVVVPLLFQLLIKSVFTQKALILNPDINMW